MGLSTQRSLSLLVYPRCSAENPFKIEIRSWVLSLKTSETSHHTEDKFSPLGLAQDHGTTWLGVAATLKAH